MAVERKGLTFIPAQISGGWGQLSPCPLGSDGPGEMLVNKFAKGKTEHYSYLGFIWLAHSKLCVKSQLIFGAQIFFHTVNARK